MAGPLDGDAMNLPDGTGSAHHTPLWDLNIVELAGHNIEAQGREEVNQLLKDGWLLLHIYTLLYRDGGVWRQRPMAILGRTRTSDS